jgi:hypothetical protein
MACLRTSGLRPARRAATLLATDLDGWVPDLHGAFERAAEPA